jgi:hypothetical protein
LASIDVSVLWPSVLEGDYGKVFDERIKNVTKKHLELLVIFI